MKKKLLILGASIAEVNVVKAARSMGYYVIVTDYNTDLNLSPAKVVADEAWNISWSDYAELENKCRQTGVDGIIAGFSEFRVDSLIQMCRRMNMPCYINDEQLDITRDKNKFKQLCRQFGVLIVNEYEPNSPEIKYPVIIKPTDRGGSIGINVAYNANEYKDFLEYALSMSPSKSVVVEDFIDDGVKFDCSYYITEDDAVLIETCDTTMLTKQKGYETMQKAWTFPSKHEKEYMEQVDENMKSLLKSLHMPCGVANISFFYRDGKFYVFETGFRLGGGHSFDYQRASGGIDYLAAMIKHALGEEYIPNMNLDQDRGYAVTYNVYFKANEGDVVEEVIGEDKIKEMNEVVTYQPFLYKGYSVKNDKPAKITMLTLYAKDLDVILSRIETINSILSVRTDKGECKIFAGLTSSEVLSAIQ